MSYDLIRPLRAEWEDRHRLKSADWTNWNYAPLILRDRLNTLDGIQGQLQSCLRCSADVVEALWRYGGRMAAARSGYQR